MNTYISALEALGANGFIHFNGSLSEHLMGTYRLLKRWNQTEVICVAGLFHAVYGPEGLGGGIIDFNEREMIRRIIGPDAEQLVYLYCICDKRFFYEQLEKLDSFYFKDRFSGKIFDVSLDTVRSMCAMMLANELELFFAKTDDSAPVSVDFKMLVSLFLKHVDEVDDRVLAIIG